MFRNISNIASNIGKLPANVNKKNKYADLILFLPEPYKIIIINKIGKMLSKNT
jgi:hypothetical protein